mgnify:CR=1 FL=1
MLIFENKSNFNIKDYSINVKDPSKTLFFDIETTGFSSAHCHLYLIGVMYLKNDEYYIKQFFLNDETEETMLLTAFFDFIKDYKEIIHFNGQGFDIPFILEKCRHYNLPYNFDAFESTDIYKCAQKVKKFINSENLKQKSIEKFLGIQRDDRFNGKELINVYHNYLKDKKKEDLALLLLHNFEDVKNMLLVYQITSYTLLADGNFTLNSAIFNDYKDISGKEKKEFIIELGLENPLPARVSASFEGIYLSAYTNTAKIKVSVYTGELKFFYPNYKDYYYLKKEDTAIHKSVAFYVDKDFRTQAKAANCYSKKTGTFLKEWEEIVTPYFKKEYNDKIMYFEAHNDFFESKELIKSYAIHLLNVLLNA